MKPTVLARRGALLCSLVILALAGCGGKGQLANEGVDVGSTQLELARDETRSITVMSKLTPGETPGSTTFSIEDLPEGVTATFDPPTVNYTTNFFQNTELTLTSSRATTAGTYTVKVRRTKEGGFATDTFKIKVVDFAVNVDVDDTSIDLAPGGSDDIDVTLRRRGNSNGTVELELGGDLPDGVSWSFDPPRVLVDADHPVVHSTLYLDADSGQTVSGSEKCHVRALKGINVDNSDDIDVKLTVPDPVEEKPVVKKPRK